MATINIEAIATDITTEQMSKACKVIDFQTGEDFYQVESSDGECDYEVRYDAEKGLTCTCEAGKHGFYNCKNYCWHCRAAAACIVATGGKPDWEPFCKVIEVIQMQTRKDWMKKYYTEEQLANLRQRWSPEVQAESESGWAALAQDTEHAIASGADPSGETGLQLAARRQKLLAMFTGGDPGMEQNLRKLYADKANWPASFNKPYNDAVDAFLCRAADALAKK